MAGSSRKEDILGGKGLVVHEQKLEVLRVLDKERLVARRHHKLGFLAVRSLIPILLVMLDKCFQSSGLGGTHFEP